MANKKKSIASGQFRWGGGDVAPAPSPVTDNLANLYRQTLGTQINSVRPQVPNEPSSLRKAASIVMGAPDLPQDSQQYKQLNNLQRRKQNAPQNIAGLMDYMAALGYDTPDVQTGLQKYLTQDVALGRFTGGKNYHAPTKMEMLAALQSSIPTSQQNQQKDALVQYADMIRQIMLNDADSYETNMYDKVGKITDPDRQASAAQAVQNFANVKRMQANSLAAQQFTPYGQGDSYIPNVLGAFNQGQTSNLSKLYGGGSNVPKGNGGYGTDNSGTGYDAGLADFLQSALGG